MDWAAESMGRYWFSDESELADAVQWGLHASRYALLPGLGLMVSPVKLLTIGATDLDTLLQAERLASQEGDGPDPTLAAQLQMVLFRHRLITQSGFAGVTSLLGKLGVATNPLFQGLGLDDLLALYAILDFPEAGNNAPLNLTAAEFAVRQARTPAEFADYYTAFLGYVTRRDAQDAPADQQSQMATDALQTVLPLLFPVLDCPSVGGLVRPDEVTKAVNDWQRQGRVVGFGRLSEAAACIMIYSNYTGGNASQAQKTIGEYCRSWQEFLSANPPERGQMGQDGASCLFPIEANGLRGELMLGQTGIISTRSFRSLPNPTPPTHTVGSGTPPSDQSKA